MLRKREDSDRDDKGERGERRGGRRAASTAAIVPTGAAVSRAGRRPALRAAGEA